MKFNAREIRLKRLLFAQIILLFNPKVVIIIDFSSLLLIAFQVTFYIQLPQQITIVKSLFIIQLILSQSTIFVP